MNLMINLPWNALSHEEKCKILYNNNNKNTIFYNEYMVNIVKN